MLYFCENEDVLEGKKEFVRQLVIHSLLIASITALERYDYHGYCTSTICYRVLVR